MQRFAEVGIRPVTRYGQNFLIDLNLIDVLVNAAELGPSDVVLEVGTGTGSLTAILAQYAAAVVTVEVDGQLHQLAREALADYPNVVMLHQDALKNKNHLHPAVLDAVRSLLDAEPGRQLKLVANLPYNIATPIVSNLIDFEPAPVLIAVTIQKEVADRIVARPRTKDYSALSVWMQSQCHIEIVRNMPPQVFWPRPKVDSAIIRIEPDRQLMAQIPDRPGFHTFVRSMFFHRRKFIRSELVAALKGQLEKPQVDEIMAEMGFIPETRAEELEVPTFLKLYEVVRRRLADNAAGLEERADQLDQPEDADS